MATACAAGLGLGLFSTSSTAAVLTADDVRDRVFVSVQNALGSSAGAALAAAGARIAAGSPELAALLRERQDLIDGLKTKQEDLSAWVLREGAEAESRVAALNTEIRQAEARVSTLDQQLYRDFPDYKDLTDPAPLQRTEVQALLHEDEALVMTLTVDNYVYVWAISKTGADWTRAEIGQQALSDKIKLLRATLSVTEANRSAEALDDSFVASVAPFDRALAHELYAQLLQPLEHVIGGARHLITVPDGPLTSLPFSILVTRSPVGSDTNADDMRQTDWLIRDHALTTLPNVPSLRVLRRQAPAAERKGDATPFMGFGDPLLGYRLAGNDAPPTGEDGAAPVYTRGIYDDIRRVADLSPLPNTARELRAMAQTLGAKDDALFLGRDATEEKVKSTDLSNADVLAFATHGLLTGGLPGLDEPALVFTPPDLPSARDDALLTASEAAQLNLSASLIILSACDTAGSDGTPGADGLSGLARSFIYAGARAIMVSHWPVDDFAAAELTTGMLSRMYDAKTPRSRAEALQASMLALMDDTSDPRLSHPKIWAPFVVVGEGGRD
ncbi:MAG: CHAT domain-containing protein [Brevirhabdus sp.]